MPAISLRRRLLSKAFFHGGIASTLVFTLADMNFAASAAACIAGAGFLVVGSSRRSTGGMKKRWRLPLAGVTLAIVPALYGYDSLSMGESAIRMAEARADIETHAEEYRQAAEDFKDLFEADELRMLAEANLQWADVDLKSFDGKMLGLMPAVGAVLTGDLKLSEARKVGGEWPAADRLVQVAVDYPQPQYQERISILQCWADGDDLVTMIPVFGSYITEDTEHRRYETIDIQGETVGIAKGLWVPGRYDLSDLKPLTPLKEVCKAALALDL